MRKMQVVRRGELTGPLAITDKQERELFSRLNRAGMIALVRRGLYLVPSHLPLGSKWTPGAGLALNTLMEDLQGRYQVCGPNAFNRYGFDEQIPNRIYAYNNRLSGERSIGAINLTLIKVSDQRLGDTEKPVDGENELIVFSSRARTLLDGIYDWSRFDSLPRAYEWVRRELAKERSQARELVECALRYGNQGTLRRLGFLLQEIGIGPALLKRLEGELTSSKSVILFVPNASGRGRVVRRWGVVNNESIESS